MSVELKLHGGMLDPGRILHKSNFHAVARLQCDSRWLGQQDRGSERMRALALCAASAILIACKAGRVSPWWVSRT